LSELKDLDTGLSLTPVGGGSLARSVSCPVFTSEHPESKQDANTAQQNAQTITTLTGQAVTWDTLLADTAAGLTALASYVIPSGFPGYYWCAAVVQAASGTSSAAGVAAWFAATLSGVASQWHARSLPYVSGAYTAVAIAGRIGPCSAGDTIQVAAAAAGGPASLPLGTADGGSMFTLFWQGD